MNIIIRRAENSDCDKVLLLLENIAQLHHNGRPDLFRSGAKKYSREELEVIFKDPGKPVFIAADENNNVLGYAFCIIIDYKNHSVFNDYRSLYIDDLCVDESVRGQNIGGRLFEAVKEYAKTNGVYNIDLNVWEFNERAIRFYERCGMKTQRRKMELIL